MSGHAGRATALILLAVLTGAPGLYVLFLGASQFSVPWWRHLADTILPLYLGHSAAVTLGAVAWALLLGGVPAWLTFRYTFPGRAWCVFIQLLPLTLPAYVASGLFLEAWSSEFFESRAALALELGAGFAPLAFLFLRLAIARLPATPFDAAASLGAGPLQRFFRVGLPLLAAPMTAAACLVAAEAVGDYGAASRVGIATFSVGLHQQWRALNMPELATMLSLVLYALAALFAWPLIRIGLAGQRANAAGATATLAARPATPGAALGVHVLCFLTVLPGFWAPFYLALGWARERLDKTDLSPLFTDAGNTLSTALAVVLLCLIITGVFLHVLEIGERTRRADRVVWFTAINYLTPSLVLALAWLAFALTGRWVVILATTLKLLPLMLLPVADFLGRLPMAQVDAARALGDSRHRALRRVVLPQLAPVLSGGALLVFVLAATELTLALTLQPFGYGALSLRVFAWAGINMTQLSSVWVICLCLLCVYPVWRLSRLIDPPHAHA